MTAALSGSAVITLILIAFLADLDTADRLASIAGAALAAIGLVVAVVQLVRAGHDTPVAGARSVQSGGGIGRAVTGDRNRLHGSAPAVAGSPGSAPPASHPATPGERGISAAGAIGDAITGDGNDES